MLGFLRRNELVCAIFAACLAAWLWGTTARSTHPDVSDSRDYALSAWHLVHHGTYSVQPLQEDVAPQIGREPLYPLVLAGMLRAVPGLDGVTAGCLSRPDGCGRAAWRPALIANGIFIALAGLMVFATLRIWQASALACWLGGAHIWLNMQAARGRGYLLSDHFAMMLAAAAALATAWAWRSGKRWPWALVGLSYAALTLTKAVFLWLVLPLAAAALVYLAICRPRLIAAFALFAVAYALPVGSWMARNHQVADVFALSGGRTATVLSGREVFNHMSPEQYAAAFVYWTRGFGDGLARDLFPESVWGPFELYRPDGFYMVGQHRLDSKIAEMVQQGRSFAEADGDLARGMMSAILQRPYAHAASSLPLFWRGIWVDEFIVLSLPALAFLLWQAWRSRQWGVCLLVAPGVFSLLFYPLVSLNIPRYQLTAVPALACAFALAGARLLAAWRERRTGLRRE